MPVLCCGSVQPGHSIGTALIFGVTAPVRTPKPPTTQNANPKTTNHSKRRMQGPKADTVSTFGSVYVCPAWSPHSYFGNPPPFAKHQWRIGQRGEVLVWGSETAQFMRQHRVGYGEYRTGMNVVEVRGCPPDDETTITKFGRPILANHHHFTPFKKKK